MNKNTYLLGGKDLEMIKISKVLKNNNINYVDKGLSWGASIDDYKDIIKEKIENGLNPIAVELENAESVEGIEVIDHHNNYAGNKASLLQVLEKEGIEASIFDKLIAANDAGYIPAMSKILIDIIKNKGEFNGKILTKNKAISLIKKIRKLDRSIQGVTKEEEIESEKALENAENLFNGELKIVRLNHSKAGSVVEKLYEFNDWYDDLYYLNYNNLLVVSENGESNFYGNPDFCKLLKEKYPEGWTGGYKWNDIDGNEHDSEKAFFGGYIDQENLENFVKENLINFLETYDKGIIKLDNGQLLLNKYGKYEPNITFIFDKKQYFSGGLMDPNIFNRDSDEISKQFNIEGINGELSTIEGKYWKSNKGSNCFSPKKGGSHYLVNEKWGGAHSKTKGGTLKNSDNVVYSHRASSNGGGAGSDYSIVAKDFQLKLNIDEI